MNAIVVRMATATALWSLLALACTMQALAAETLRIQGSNTIGEHLAPALVERWLLDGGEPSPEWRPGAEGEGEFVGGALRVQLRSHGSNTGMRALLAGQADIAMSSRPATAEEIAAAAGAGLGRLDGAGQEYVVALDGLAIIVHPDNPLRALDVTAVRRLFSGQARDWREVGGAPGPVRLHARDERSGTWETFRTLVLGERVLSAGAVRYESSDALAEAVAADPLAIGFVGLGGARRARVLAVGDLDAAAILPGDETVAVEDYLLSRRLYLYLRSDASPQARAFAEFAVGPAAQPLVAQAGFVTQTIREVALPPAPEVPEEYLRLVDGARRLSLNFRFGQGAGVLDTRGERDLDRLTRFLAEPARAGTGVLLIGFVEASETLPYLALALSNERVDYIAEQLSRRGIRVTRARGLGGALPVASSATEQGRRRNRRVEVWIAEAGG
ncbi:MAG: substrate-binding domain-containing protein [Xanthomonadales bacterium]|nr:substrate-binding domain-containing protein [Xanthomonadales bacterium]